MGVFFSKLLKYFVLLERCLLLMLMNNKLFQAEQTT